MREHLELLHHTERTADEAVLKHYPPTLKKKVLRCVWWAGGWARVGGPCGRRSALRVSTVGGRRPGPAWQNGGVQRQRPPAAARGCARPRQCAMPWLHWGSPCLMWHWAREVPPSCSQARVPGGAARLLPLQGLPGPIPGRAPQHCAHRDLHAQRECAHCAPPSAPLRAAACCTQPLRAPAAPQMQVLTEGEVVSEFFIVVEGAVHGARASVPGASAGAASRRQATMDGRRRSVHAPSLGGGNSTLRRLSVKGEAEASEGGLSMNQRAGTGLSFGADNSTRPHDMSVHSGHHAPYHTSASSVFHGHGDDASHHHHHHHALDGPPVALPHQRRTSGIAGHRLAGAGSTRFAGAEGAEGGGKGRGRGAQHECAWPSRVGCSCCPTPRAPCAPLPLHPLCTVPPTGSPLPARHPMHTRRQHAPWAKVQDPNRGRHGEAVNHWGPVGQGPVRRRGQREQGIVWRGRQVRPGGRVM